LNGLHFYEIFIAQYVITGLQFAHGGGKMRRLKRAWCTVCGERTTWEADENGLLRCLDAEHLACVTASQARQHTTTKKVHASKLTAILGVLHSLTQEQQW
jgi:hypothetical protein